MNQSQALTYLQGEHDNNSALTSIEKSTLQNCIDVLNNSSSIYSKPGACELLTDLYWDASVTNQNEFGQAVFAVAYTVDPNKPMPTVKV